MAYDLPTNISSISDLMVYNNDVTGGFFSIGILFVIFIILFMLSRKTNDGAESIAISAFITSISGILLSVAGLFPQEYVLLPIGLAAVSFIMLVMSKR